MPLSEERRQHAFNNAMTPRQFVESMEIYRERLESGYEATEFRPETLTLFAALPETLEVLGLVEDTSGDVVFNLPILMKLADCTGKLNIHLLRRSNNQDIAAQYILRSGRNHLPTYIFYNTKGDELGTFIERPLFVMELMADWFQEFWEKHPDLPGFGTFPGQMPEASRLVLNDFFAEKREPLRAQEAETIAKHILKLVS
ncbi:MAG: thioredoxin family protein [Chloroflexi bacterium]|uniref:Thioredoxin family protein n=1 Tax=Candidatus Chlorohelix allophototropha TaxID=3003348 RepID=A0A8T7M0J2_9CHLR|nr:thioredoxin family protein [Chloroflexota bacterium]WJW67312.1 thioredoxin family protein [Chloroflexota bacterium L227-S17]